MNTISIRPLSEIPGVHTVKQLLPLQRYQRTAPSKTRVYATSNGILLNPYNQLQAILPVQNLYALPEVTVLGKGCILAGKTLVQDNLEGSNRLQLVKTLEATNLHPETTITEPVLYVTRYGIKNYGHCLTDITPRIIHALRVWPELKVALHPDFVETVLEVLLDFGITSDRWILLPERPTRLTHGFFASACNLHPLVHCPSSIKLLRSRLPNLIKQAASTGITQNNKRLFVTRNDTKTRHLTNQTDVEAALLAQGISPVTTANLNHAQQAQLFHQADEIIGIAGASLTNLIYCRPGTRVTMLAPTTMPATYFWDIASQVGLDMRIGYFPATQPAKGIYSDFTAPISDILELHEG